MPFDGNLRPVKPGGFTVKSIGKKGLFLEGVRSQAIAVSDEQLIPQIRFPDNISAEKGTVEFWFSPENWDNRKVYQVHWLC